MNRNELTKQVEKLANAIVADLRWENGTLDVVVLGMLLYGYALALGRMAMMLEAEDIDAAVLSSISRATGAAQKWTSGLVEDANASAFNKDHHPGNHELIGVGHSYFGVKDQEVIVDNVFANIASVRKRAG